METVKVLITGGANGIGLRTAEMLAEDHDVTVLDSDTEKLEEVDEELDSIEADVTEDMEEKLENLEVDVLINSAGIQKRGAIQDQPFREIEEHIQVNYLGTVRTIKTLLPELKQRSGRIINISSVAGRGTIPFLGAYSGSKYAVEGLSDALRMELKESGVEVVVVEPGPIDTGFNVRGIEAMERYLPETEFKEEYSKRLEEKDRERANVNKAAEKIVKAAESSSPKPRYTVTTEAFLLPKIKAVLPTKLYDRLAWRF
jgi:short-subunit dehydrogenase